MSRRLLAAAVAIFAGAVGAIAFAVPARADVPDNVNVEFVKSGCLINGVRQVLWDLTNNKAFEIKLTEFDVTPAGSGLSAATNTLVPAGGVLHILQEIPPGGGPGASLEVHWVANNPAEDPGGNTVDDTVFETPCVAEVKATFEPNCDGSTNVTLINETRETQHFVVNELPPVDVPPGNKVVPNVPQSPVGEVNVLVAASDDVDPELLGVATYKWVSPENCPTPPPSTLSNTGTSLTGVIAVGGVLLLGGVVVLLVLMFMRRRSAS